uniref:Uncharacterized protein n=1 Tax=Arundo donax TaxID=35708 RepID=A0A0A9GJY7_ARUDO
MSACMVLLPGVFSLLSWIISPPVVKLLLGLLDLTENPGISGKLITAPNYDQVKWLWMLLCSHGTLLC